MNRNALKGALAGLVMSAVSAGAQATENVNALRAEVFSHDGHDIHYRIGGRGPHLLLLHGFTLTGHQWDPFLDALMRHYTVIVADLPGHGMSSDVAGHFDFRRTAGAMHALLDSAGAKRAYAIGHSAGGITLLHMQKRRPDRFNALVLVDAPHRFEPEGLALLGSETFESLGAEALAFYRDMQPGGDEQIRRLHELSGWLAEDHEEFAVARSQLAAIDTPTLIVWGDRDPYVPVEIALEMYRALPNARLWVVPAQGHSPVFEYLGGASHAAGEFPGMVVRFFSAVAATHNAD